MTDFTTTPAFENATDTTDAPIEQFFSQAQNAPVLDNAALHIDSEELDSDVEVLTISLDTAAETSPVQDDAESESNTEAFAALGLTPVLLKSIAATGYTNPTPIQAQAIPAALAGRDLLLSAQTGSGKTAAFVLPVLHGIHTSKEHTVKRGKNTPKAVKALILTPTRELAHQVSDSIRKYGSSMRDLFSVPLVGGAAYSGQIRALKKGVQIIVATPGRLLDHINAGRVDLSQLSVLILDEADRMLDMGFADDIEAILQATPSTRQTIMSSATWDGPVGKIAESFTTNPERISIKVETAHIDEKVYFCDNFDHKNKLLESLICDQDRGQAIIFTATKRSSEELAERLQEWGHKACYLHGDLPQSKRNRIVADLRSGKHDIVVATDVAARGIDLPNITHVFNYDLPRQVEDYVHRIGRSGRAGRTGIAINLCSRDDRRQFGNIHRYLKRDITEAVVEGLEPRFVEKFGGRDRGDSRGRGRQGQSQGYSRQGRGDSRGRFDNRNNNRSFDNRSDRQDNRNDRGFDKAAQGNQDSYKKPFARRDDRPNERSNDRFENKGYAPRRQDDNRGGYQERSDKPSYERSRSRDSYAANDSAPRRRREDDNRGFERAAKTGDKPYFNRERNDDRGNSHERSNSYERRESDNRGNSQGRFEKRTDSRNDWKKQDNKAGFGQKPRKPKLIEETFGGDRPRRSEGHNAHSSSRHSDSRQDGFAAPKRARKDGDKFGKQDSRDGFQRRNSSGKPL